MVFLPICQHLFQLVHQDSPLLSSLMKYLLLVWAYLLSWYNNRHHLFLLFTSQWREVLVPEVRAQRLSARFPDQQVSRFIIDLFELYLLVGLLVRQLLPLHL